MPKSRGTVLITGASSGIGRAIAELLAKSNYRVFGASRSPKPIAGVENIVVDVTDDASAEACVSTVLSKAGAIDVLVNNAGVAMVGAIEESSLAQAKAMFEVNLFGVMRMTRAVLPAMRARRSDRAIAAPGVCFDVGRDEAGLDQA